MPKKFATRSFTDFSGGLSTKSSKFAEISNPLDKHYGLKCAADVNNVLMSENGLEKFPGYVNYLNSILPAAVSGIFEYEKTGTGGSRYFLVTAGTKVYTASGGSVTEIYSGINADAYPQFIKHATSNVALILNGVNVMLQYDGTTCAAVSYTDPDSIFKNTGGTTATPSFAGIFRGRIFFGGDPTYPNRLWTPRPGTYNNFDNTLSTVDVFDIEGEGKLVGFRAVSKDLAAIYKTKSISRLSGSTPFGSTTDPFAIEEVSQKTGCVAPRTIVQVGRDHLFLSRSGIKKISLVFDYGDVDQLDPMAENQDAVSDINFTDGVIDNAFATFMDDERQVYFHLPTGSSTQNNVVYVYDILTGAISIREGITASCGAIVNGNYYTGGYDGQICQQLNGNSFADAAIESRWESKWLALDNLETKKIFRRLLIYFDTSGTATITVQWQIMKMDGKIRSQAKSSEAIGDNVFDVGKMDEAVFDIGGETLFKKKDLGRGRAIKLIISNNNANERWKVSRIELSYQPLGIVEK